MGLLDFLFRRKKAAPVAPQLSQSSPDRTMMGISIQGEPPPDASTQMGIVIPPPAAAAPFVPPTASPSTPPPAATAPPSSSLPAAPVPPSAPPPTAAAPSSAPYPFDAATRMVAAQRPAPPEELERTRQLVVPPKPKARLARKSGGSGGPWELLPREYEIGRSSSADIIVPDPSVSGHHAKLVPHGDGFAIRDLGSTNGTKVNGKVTSGDCALRGGETITLGEVTLGYERL